MIRKVKATNPDGTPKKRIVKKKPAESKEANEVVQEVSEDLSSVSYVVRLGQHPAPDGVSLSDKEISPETLDLKDVGDIKDLKEVKGPEDHAHLLQSTSTNPSDNNTSICSELPPKSQSSSSIASSQSSSSTATVIAKSGSSTQINNGSSSSLSSVTTPTVNGHVSMKSTEPSVNGVQSTLTSTCTTVPETSNCLNNENSNVNGVEKDVTLKGETDRSIDAMNTTLNEAATVKKESESVLNRASYFDKPLNRDSPESGLNGTTSNGHSSGQECIPQNETGHLSNGVGLRSSSSELSSNSRPNVQDKSAAKTEPRKNGFHERHLSDRVSLFSLKFLLNSKKSINSFLLIFSVVLWIRFKKKLLSNEQFPRSSTRFREQSPNVLILHDRILVISATFPVPQQEPFLSAALKS